jgi:predicted phage tail protein
MVVIGKKAQQKFCGIGSLLEMAMVEVKLLGELGRRFGRSYQFAANSPKEIISALSNQLAGFKDYLTNAHENGIAFRLIDGDEEGMCYENVLMPCRRLIIAPVVTGSGAVGRILIGVALVALAFVSFGAPGTAFAGFAAGKGFALGSGILFSLGASLVLTGVASLLTPAVRLESDSERKDSFLFDRAAELTSQGAPVPILYGRFLAGSPLIISSAITTEQVPV